MAFLLRVRSLLLTVLLCILLLIAMQDATQALPGLASYYGDELAGNPTASGEPFDPNGLTAAHPYLPFGTLLTVSNNGRSVTVRVNDRGPFVPGRGLDLSLGAAQAIGLTDSGTAVVEVEAAGTPEAKPQVTQSSEPTEPAKPTHTPTWGKRVAFSMIEDSLPGLHRVDAPYGTTSSSKAPLATSLAEGREEQVDPTLYARPAIRGRRRGGELSEGVV